MKTYCNPLDLGYRYQHMKEGERIAGFREGADPTLVYFKGKYYLFVSMSAGFWYSDDLLHWDFHADPDLLIYDYAPDVRQVGGYLYFSASRKGRNCPILRTADPLTEPFTEVSAPFAFWDPDMFWDDDGRVYFYWGCSNMSPIWGVELDPETMTPIGEKKELIFGREEELGYERPGNNGIVDKESSVLYKSMKPFYNEATGKLELPPQMAQMPGLNAEVLPRHPVQHLRRRRVHIQVPAGTVHAAGIQSVFLQAGRVYDGCRTRQHHCRQVRQLLARIHDAHFGQPRL